MRALLRVRWCQPLCRAADMSATRPQRINWAAEPWTPAADVAAMLEGISGNAVNGVGEGLQRAPRQIFWSRKPETLVHEKMQRYTVDRFNNAPAFETIYTKADRGPRLDAPAPLSIEKSAAQWTIELKAFARNRPALSAAGDQQRESRCTRRAQVVGGFRQVHALLQPNLWLRHLHRGVSLEYAGAGTETGRTMGPAPEGREVGRASRRAEWCVFCCGGVTNVLGARMARTVATFSRLDDRRKPC